MYARYRLRRTVRILAIVLVAGTLSRLLVFQFSLGFLDATLVSLGIAMVGYWLVFGLGRISLKRRPQAQNVDASRSAWKEVLLRIPYADIAIVLAMISVVAVLWTSEANKDMVALFQAIVYAAPWWALLGLVLFGAAVAAIPPYKLRKRLRDNPEHPLKKWPTEGDGVMLRLQQGFFLFGAPVAISLAAAVLLTPFYRPPSQDETTVAAILLILMAAVFAGGAYLVGKSIAYGITANVRKRLLKTHGRELVAEPRSIRDTLARRIAGQDHAIDTVVQTMRRTQQGFKARPNKPDAIFLFVGPTGVGKTELAKAIAAARGTGFVTIDMGQYTNHNDPWKLWGSHPSYINARPGDLTAPVARDPHATVLLDEIEKAWSGLWGGLLPLFDEGRMRDDYWTQDVDFSNTVVVMTSNLLGMDDATALDDDTIRKKLLASGRIPPEVVGRVDAIVKFRQIDRDAATELVRRHLHGTLRRVAQQRHLDIICEGSVLTRLLEAFGDGSGGVRQLMRIADREVLDRLLMDPPRNGRVRISARDGTVDLAFEPVEEKGFFKKKTVAPRVEVAPAPDAEEQDTASQRKAVAGVRGLTEAIIGQAGPIRAVADFLELRLAGIGRSGTRSVASFLLLGPTGVGKTELVKRVASVLDRPMLRYDMGNFQTDGTYTSFLGTPPGHHDADRGGGIVRAVQGQPNAVILLDEIEKGHPRIWDLFLPVLDEGRMQELGPEARTASFLDTIIFMTSNLVQEVPDGQEQDLREHVASLGYFRPELVNRVDRIVAFNRLGYGALRRILMTQAKDLITGWAAQAGREIPEVRIRREAIDLLLSRVNPKFGARDASRIVTEEVGRALLAAARSSSDQPEWVVVRRANGRIIVTLHRNEGSAS